MLQKTKLALNLNLLIYFSSSEDLTKINKSIIEVKDLFHILDFIFSKELVKSVQKKLISFYPTLKVSNSYYCFILYIYFLLSLFEDLLLINYSKEFFFSATDSMFIPKLKLHYLKYLIKPIK